MSKNQTITETDMRGMLSNLVILIQSQSGQLQSQTVEMKARMQFIFNKMVVTEDLLKGLDTKCAIES